MLTFKRIEAAILLTSVFLYSVHAAPFSLKTAKSAVAYKSGNRLTIHKRSRDILTTRGGDQESFRTMETPGLFIPGKKHPWFGTSPILHPMAYPILDVIFQMFVFSLATLFLSGTAKTITSYLFCVHGILFFITDFGVKWLPIPAVPLKLMYLLDFFMGIFFVVSPFLIDGYGDAKWVFSVGFAISICFFAFLDPKPAVK